MKQITLSDMRQQREAAASSPRLRAPRNFHPQLSDPVQRLAVAMEPGTYVRPHRHPPTFELLLPLSGRFVVLHFADPGHVPRRVILGGEGAAAETADVGVEEDGDRRPGPFGPGAEEGPEPDPRGAGPGQAAPDA